MSNPKHVAEPNLDELFAALTDMTRGLIGLARKGTAQVKFLTELESSLAKGWMLRTEFAIGHAGALGFNLLAVSPQGEVAEIISVEPPTNTGPFRLVG